MNGLGGLVMAWFDQKIATDKLHQFFSHKKSKIDDFGKRVSQTFEAATFAQTIKWYEARGWNIDIINPPSNGGRFRLKYSTRGDAKNYTYVICFKHDANPSTIQIRHQIRVETHHNIRRQRKKYKQANIVCDVAILKNFDHNRITGNMHVSKQDLVSFGEAKHMDAYAELLAGFIGLVHELQPWRLSNDRSGKKEEYKNHIRPFLNLSGFCHNTAEAIKETINRRKLDIDIFDLNNPLVEKMDS